MRSAAQLHSQVTALMRRLKTSQADFDARLAELLAFEAAQDPKVDETVSAILADVRARGDAALLEHSRRLDRVQATSMEELEIARDACAQALEELNPPLREALTVAAGRVRDYHERQRAQSWRFTDAHGNELGQKITALDRVGVYVPGGKAAYPSSV